MATGHRGVGGALVLDGALYAGSSGLGIEAGHVGVDPRGARAGAATGLPGRGDRRAEPAGHGRPGRACPVFPRLEQATALLRDEYPIDAAVQAGAGIVMERLGLGLAGLINVLNPDRILLGGLHADLLAADPERLRAAVAARSPWGRAAACRCSAVPWTTAAS